MPSSVGGDLIRAWYITRHTHKRFEAALSVFVDRLIGLASTLVIAVFFYTLFLRTRHGIISFDKPAGLFKSVVQYRWHFLWAVTAIAAVFCVLLLFKTTREILRKCWSYIYARALKMIKKFKDAVIIYCSKPLTILAVFVLTVCMQIMTITGFWILGVNMGIDAGVKYYYVFFTLMWVVAALPVSIGGAVVMEGGLAYLFIKFAGVQPELALALALCQRIVWMITSLPGAAIHLFGAHLPKHFFIDSEQSLD